MKKFAVPLTLAVAFVISACSSSHDSGNGQGSSPNPTGDPINLLSPTDHDTMVAWEGKLEKSCVASDIFSDQPQGPMGMDAKVLFAKNGHSLVVRGQNGNFAILGTPSLLFGTQDTEYDRSVSVSGGGTYSVSVKTHYESGVCEVSVNGQSTLKFPLVASFPIIAAYDPKSSPGKFVASDTHLNPSSQPQAAELQGVGFGDALQAALQPNANASHWIAAQLGTTANRSESEFDGSGAAAIQPVLTLPSSRTVLPFGLGNDGFLGDEQELQNLISQPSLQALLIQFAPPRIQLGDETNSADGGLVPLTANIALDPNPADHKLHYTVQSVSLGAITAYDDAGATSCWLNRVAMLQRIDQATSVFNPNYTRSVTPCQFLSGDFDSAILASRSAIEEFSSRFAHGYPRGYDYQGWDEELSALIQEVAASGQDIRKTLDPNSESPVIDQISMNLSAIAQAVSAQDTRLVDVSRGLTEMALHWGLQGNSVSAGQLGSILAALNNSVQPFKDSTANLIDSLSADPNSQDSVAGIAFAAQINDSYKGAALTFAQSGGGIGADFISQKMSEVIQQRYTIDQFGQWKGTLDAAQAFASRDRARMSSAEAFFDNELNSLVETALKEGWTDATFGEAEAIAPLSKYSDFCGQQVSSITGLINCESNVSQYSTAAGKLLDPKFGDRYVRASGEFQLSMQKLSDQEFYSDRNSLMNAFFGPVWSKCDNSSFNGKLQTVHSLTDQIVAADFSQRFQLENSLRDLLTSDCSN